MGVMSEAPVWVVVADAGYARVFETQSRGQPWTLIEDHDVRRARRTAKGIMADAPGRVHRGHGSGNTALQPQTDPTEVEAQLAARNLAGELGHARTQHAFRALIVVASPHFLGLLRHAIDKDTARLVVHEEAKDLTGLSQHELTDRLAALIPEA